MDEALMMAGALLLPALAFALLLWLTHLEETLPRDVRAGMRDPEPPPILAVPVRDVPRVRTVRAVASIPAQREAQASSRAPTLS